MPICLPENLTSIFREKLVSGEINPEKIAAMSSKERRAFFTEFLGEANAHEVNALFESKLLLKDQQRGLVTWAKQTVGITKEAKRDMISRVDKMSEVLQPETVDDFLADLVEHKLGVAVSMEEAGKIAELSKIVKEKEVNRGNSEKERLEYGVALVEFHEYVNELKTDPRGVAEKFGDNPAGFVKESINELAGSARNMKATADNSYIGRQGIKAMWTHPATWAKHSLNSWKRGVQAFKGENPINAVNADIMSRDNSVNGNYKKGNLAVAAIEEEFPSALPEKLPLFGRVVKAADVAFTSQAHLTRADLFDLYYAKAEDAGVDLNNKENLKAIGGLVNSLTGRGHLGKVEPIGNFLNNFIFSPRFFASNVQVFTQPFTGAQGLTGDKGTLKGTNFVRKQAAINLMKIVSGTLAVLLTANALDDEAVEWDSRSVDFGKIRIGDTSFDITGGMGSIIVLLSRVITGETKSSRTHLVRELNTGEFGSRDKLDVLVDFSVNKLSPVASVLKEHFITGETFEGETPTLKTAAVGLYVPIPIENFFEMQDSPDAANTLVGMILDGLGFGSNTYSVSNNWNTKNTDELTQFKEEVGQKEFDTANEQFNRVYIEWFKDVSKDSEFQALTDEDKSTVISKKKKEFKKDVFKDYNFKVKKTKTNKLPKF